MLTGEKLYPGGRRGPLRSLYIVVLFALKADGVEIVVPGSASFGLGLVVWDSVAAIGGVTGGAIDDETKSLWRALLSASVSLIKLAALTAVSGPINMKVCGCSCSAICVFRGCFSAADAAFDGG